MKGRKGRHRAEALRSCKKHTWQHAPPCLSRLHLRHLSPSESDTPQHEPGCAPEHIDVMPMAGGGDQQLPSRVKLQQREGAGVRAEVGHQLPCDHIPHHHCALHILGRICSACRQTTDQGELARQGLQSWLLQRVPAINGQGSAGMPRQAESVSPHTCFCTGSQSCHTSAVSSVQTALGLQHCELTGSLCRACPASNRLARMSVGKHGSTMALGRLTDRKACAAPGM